MTESAVEVRQRRQHCDLLVELSGELDSMSAPRLIERFDQLPLDDPCLRRVVIDLADLSFLDSSGISALIDLHRRADGFDLGFRMVNVRGIQHQVLEIVGLLDYFHVDADPQHVE